jgi:hypothetical protein
VFNNSKSLWQCAKGSCCLALFHSILLSGLLSYRGGVEHVASCTTSQNTLPTHLQMPNFLVYICSTKGESKINFLLLAKYLNINRNFY